MLPITDVGCTLHFAVMVIWTVLGTNSSRAGGGDYEILRIIVILITVVVWAHSMIRNAFLHR